MKTWMMYKNHYGKALPSPVYQSDLRKNRQKAYAVKNTATKITPKGGGSIESYPARFYAYQLIVIAVVMFFGLALIAGYLPEVAQFLDL